MPKAISRLSALVAVRLWIEAHHQPPTADECIPSNGLPHYSTLRHHFIGLCKAIQLANQLQDKDLEHWRTSVTPVQYKQRHCLMCNRPIQVRDNIWRCDACRRQANTTMEMEPVLTKARLRQFGLASEEENW